MFASLSASAKQDAEVLGVAFGSTCEETVQKLSKDYGTPKTQSADKLVYLNEMFEGFKADRVELGGRPVGRTEKRCRKHDVYSVFCIKQWFCQHQCLL